MATKLRTITNAGQPLVDAHGDVLASTRVTFTLVDYHGDQKDSFDATTHERIVSSDIYTTTNSSGIFSINLWPTSRGVDAVYYLCHVSHTGVKDFIAPLPDGEAPLSWSVFKAGGATLTAADQSALALHIADEDVHGLVPIVNLTTSTTTTLDGILKGDTGALAVAVPSVDYLVPTDLDSFATVATTGSYNDLADVPTSLPPDTHTHVATDVTEDTTHRFATDAEKTTWNAKVGTTDARLSDARTPVAHVHAPADVTEDENNRFVTDADIVAWNAKQDALGFTAVATTDARLSDSRAPLAHTQAATTITEDSTHRFVTDTEKSAWTAKQDALGFTPSAVGHDHEYSEFAYVPEDPANKGVASGYCPLDADGLVSEDYLPLTSFVVDTYTTLQFNDSIEGVTIFVTDASGDPSLTSGWGLYIGDGTDWLLVQSEQYGASVTESATRRFVTDTEKSTWSGKQDALGFTAENSANKGAANGYAPLGADQKVPSANLPTMAAGSVAWDDVTSKPTTFAPSTHASTHSTGQADAITPSNIGAAASSHTHGATDVTEDSTHRFVTDTDKSTWSGKQDALGFTAENSANKGQANGYAGLGADGLVPTAQLPASNTTFLSLTDTPSSYSGQASKVVRVNSGATALEFVDASTPGAHASTHADGGSDEVTPAAIGAATDDHTHTVAIGITVDGSGSVLTTGSKGFRTIPDAATIVGWQIISDQSGSIVFDIKKCAHANFPTTASICASAKPTVSSAQIAHDETLTGWTTAITAGDILEFVIDSASTVTRATLTLHIQI